MTEPLNYAFPPAQRSAFRFGRILAVCFVALAVATLALWVRSWWPGSTELLRLQTGSLLSSGGWFVWSQNVYAFSWHPLVPEWAAILLFLVVAAVGWKWPLLKARP